MLFPCWERNSSGQLTAQNSYSSAGESSEQANTKAASRQSSVEEDRGDGSLLPMLPELTLSSAKLRLLPAQAAQEAPRAAAAECPRSSCCPGQRPHS